MKKYFCLFLWISFFAINIKALEDDTRVGSRGMWVEKHLNGFLTLHLRKCLCSNNTAKVCLCWNNVDKQDQPAVQGSVVNILSSFLNYFDFSEVGFGFYTNQETNEQICKFPDQQMLVSLLKLAKIDHLFSLENSKLNYNKFLSLISVGKFPLAQVEDNYDSLKYHMYFHDVFNHMPIWLVLPVKYRNLVVNKVNNFLIFSQNIKNELIKEEPEVVAIWQLVELFFAISLDTSSGNLNNLLFLKSKWWELASFSEEEQIKIICKLESLFNIGIVISNKEKRPCCIIDEESSFDYLLSIYLDFIDKILFNYHGQAEKLLYDYPSFKNEQNLFNIVVDLSMDDKQKNISIIKSKVKEVLVKFTNDNIEHTLSLEEFFSLINKQGNILKNHIKCSPIII